VATVPEPEHQIAHHDASRRDEDGFRRCAGSSSSGNSPTSLPLARGCRRTARIQQRVVIDNAQPRQAVADQADDGAKLTDAMQLVEINLIEAIWAQWSGARQSISGGVT
jgi:hypothetical protein